MDQLLLFSLLFLMGLLPQKTDRIIARQGRISFFSYTTVENIQAENNQVLSIVDLSTHEVAVSMLMNAFVFKKALMREHFNESYVESEIYPEAHFEGKIINFDPSLKGEQIRFIKGVFTMRDIGRELEIKTKIEHVSNKYIFTGTFETLVEDYKIKIPPLLAPNIAKTITVEFRFEYDPYEN